MTKDINDITNQLPFKIKDNVINIIVIYSKERMCSALEENHIILDYGFIELLADSLLFESFSNELLATMENIDSIDFTEKEEPEITGSMLARDITCKFIESLFSNENHQNKLLDLVLWPIDSENFPDYDERPAKLYYNKNINENILTNLINKRNCHANIGQLLNLATQFVMCHELSHLANPHVNTESWKQSKVGIDVGEILSILLESEIPSLFNNTQSISLSKIVNVLNTHPKAMNRAEKEAIIDISAIDFILHRKIVNKDFLDSEKWGEFIASLFTIISLSNALIIFRYHIESTIKIKNLQSLYIHVARGEATLRNLLVLSYLIHKNSSLLPFEESSIFIIYIKNELLTLERRTLFFSLDMTTFINEEDWPSFIDQVFS